MQSPSSIFGISKGFIPWPIGKHHDGARARFLIVTGGLEQAVRREAVSAVACWWGVSRSCVGRWRNAMGLEGVTEGTHHLLKVNAQAPGVQAGLAKATAKANDPARRAKRPRISGRRLSPESRRKISEAHQGKTLTEEHRRKISITQREIKENIWTSEEDELVRTLKAPEVVERTGRTLRAVYKRRQLLGVARKVGYNGRWGQ